MIRRADLVDFDYGNVLASFDTHRWLDFLRVHQRPRGRDPNEFFHVDFVSRYELNLIDEFEFFELTKKHFGLKVSLDEFFFELTFNVRPDLRMIALRQMLRQNGVKLAVVSNINRYHFEYVRQKWPEVFMGFDYLALSFRMKARKPDHRMYNAPAKRLGIPPERCFLIDDLKVNIDAFDDWGGIGHHYNVVDEKFCPNGRLETERNKLLLRMANLGMLTHSQAGKLMPITFRNLKPR